MGPGRHHRCVGEAVRRWINVLVPLVLAAALVAPLPRLGPEHPAKPAQRRFSKALKKIAAEQHWRMYAPNPARAYTKAYLMAVDDANEERPLAEALRADADDGRVWLWRRRRDDFWRFRIVAVHTDRPTPARRWYMRAACVREARSGEPPRVLRLYGERVRLRHPDQVRAGKSVLTPPDRRLIEAISCRMGRARLMIEDDAG